MPATAPPSSPSKPTGDLRDRAKHATQRLCLPTAIIASIFVVWTVITATSNNDRDVLPAAIPATLAIAALIGLVILAVIRKSGWAFAATALALALAITTLFVSLFPRVLVSDPNFQNSLTVQNAASGHYPLVVITITALILLPVVLITKAGPTTSSADDCDR